MNKPPFVPDVPLDVRSYSLSIAEESERKARRRVRRGRANRCRECGAKLDGPACIECDVAAWKAMRRGIWRAIA